MPLPRDLRTSRNTIIMSNSRITGPTLDRRWSWDNALTVRSSPVGPVCCCCRYTVPCPPCPRTEMSVHTSSGLPGRVCTMPLAEKVVASFRESKEIRGTVVMAVRCVDRNSRSDVPMNNSRETSATGRNRGPGQRTVAQHSHTPDQMPIRVDINYKYLYEHFNARNHNWGVWKYQNITS